MAQSEDSVSIDSVSQAQEEPVPAKRPKPKAFIMGRISSKTILANMPQYKAMQRSMVALKAQYEAEAKKSEEDFQRKFEEFMQGQKEFPKTILEKRQNELQNMLETNAQFRIKVQTLLAEAEKSLMADIMAEMSEAISTVAQAPPISCICILPPLQTNKPPLPVQKVCPTILPTPATEIWKSCRWAWIKVWVCGS